MDSYIEYALSKKTTLKDRIPVIASILLALAGIGAWLVWPTWIASTAFVAGAVLTVVMANRQSIEYEYIFVNGDCEVSKIVQKSSRKQLTEFEVKDVLQIMPYTSAHFQNELEINSSMKVRNYTSCNVDKKEQWYAFMLDAKDHPVAVILELNDKCVQHVKSYYKNKFQA